MNEFEAIDDKDSVAVASNGIVFDLDLTNFTELTLIYKDGVFHYITGSKEAYVLDGFQAGDTISTGMTHEDTSGKDSSKRSFFGRLSGRYKKTARKELDTALNQYEKCLARKLDRTDMLIYWSHRFRVKPVTVQCWMAKHRKLRRKESPNNKEV